MSNDINITIGATEDASKTIEGIGDSTKRVESIIVKSMGSTEDAFDTTVRSSSKLGGALDTVEGFAGKATEGIEGVGSAVDATADIMNYARNKASRLAHAQDDVAQASLDVDQAMQDLRQTERDEAQATIDVTQASQDKEQALLDQKTALKNLKDVQNEYGKNSDEAKQAMLDYKQAGIDVTQAEEDLKQAKEDSRQATLDAEQATLDQTTATNDLTDAQGELASEQSTMTQVTDWVGMLSGLLTGLVGIIGAVSAVQWAWNAALAANPIGITIAAIVILIGIIVLIAKKTTWFQDLWHAIWGKIGDPVKKTWNTVSKATTGFFKSVGKYITELPHKIKNAFKSVGNYIASPFKAGYRAIANAWNSSIGSFSISVPSWVPIYGGKGWSFPRIPSFAIGGDVLKTGLAMIHQGERIIPRASAQRLAPMDATAMPATQTVNVQLEIDSQGNSHAEAWILELLAKNLRVKNVINSTIQDTVRNRGNGSVQLTYGRKGVS